MEASSQFFAVKATSPTSPAAASSFEFGEGHEDGSNPDWDIGYYKGDCGAGRYVGGMSRDLTAQPGAPHALLCCSP